MKHTLTSRDAVIYCCVTNVAILLVAAWLAWKVSPWCLLILGFIVKPVDKEEPDT